MVDTVICAECGAKDRYGYKDTIRRYEGTGYEVEMSVKVPFCKTCGAPIYIEAIEEKIAQDANKKIREQLAIITREEIEEILHMYAISQKALSKLLGWGEITLTRYINKNYTPNLSNSNKLKGLKNPYVFQMLLQDHRERGAKDSEKKDLQKVEASVRSELEKLEKTYGKIFRVIHWFLMQSSNEAPITHLALQKLLYFTQSWSMALLGEGIFDDDCQAWVHGAVYPQVYSMFKCFRYTPLPTVKMQLQFTDEESKILDAVKHSYLDLYSAKALEEICHREPPYIKARKGHPKDAICHEMIDKKDIFSYYAHISQEYDINLANMSNIKRYLNFILG